MDKANGLIRCILEQLVKGHCLLYKMFSVFFLSNAVNLEFPPRYITFAVKSSPDNSTAKDYFLDLNFAYLLTQYINHISIFSYFLFLAGSVIILFVCFYRRVYICVEGCMDDKQCCVVFY